MRLVLFDTPGSGYAGMFLKNADAVIGPGDTIVLPEHTEPWIFMHEAELALVIEEPAKDVKRDDWTRAVFGYTGMIDVLVRFWVDGQLRHNDNTDDMEHDVPQLVEFATAIMTLHTGRVAPLRARIR